MNVFNSIDDIFNDTIHNKIIRSNGTVVINGDGIPRTKHERYKPLTDNEINKYIIEQYSNNVPMEYINFLKYSNGISLFNFKIKFKNLAFAGCGLTIYGIPRTPNQSRDIDEEEPFDVRIEDLRRHKKISLSWLCIGRFQYVVNDALGREASIFIDCNTHKVYTCPVDDYVILETWDNLDLCLSDLIVRLKEYKQEYLLS